MFGMGTFCNEKVQYYNTVAGEFASGSGLDESCRAGINDCSQVRMGLSGQIIVVQIA